MIAYAGMGDKLPNLCYYNTQEQFQKPYSEKTAELIDNEVKALIAEQYERAKRMLLQYKDGHRQLAELLMEREVIFAEDAERIFGKRPWASRSEEILEPAQEEIKVEEAKPAKEETTLQATEPNDTEGKNDQYQPNNPSDHKSKETSTLSEAPEYSKPTKPKTERTRKPKNDNLFDGFDFDQEKEE
jgi:cell division protease FtsH